MEDNDMVFNEIELKAFAFDFVASHGDSLELSAEAEEKIFIFVKELIEHFRGV